MSKVVIKIAFCCLLFASCQEQPTYFDLQNETGNIQLRLATNEKGQAFYLLKYKGESLLDTSFLGVRLSDTDLTTGLKLVAVEGPEQIVDSYQMQHGKQQQITYSANKYSALFENEQGEKLQLELQLSAQGMAYRYHLPKLSSEWREGKEGEMDSLIIKEELSTFGFKPNTKAWMQPMSEAKSGWRETNPSYEEHYQMAISVRDTSPLGEGYVFPALFQTDSTWMLLSEANVHRQYCGSRLQWNDSSDQLSIRFPQEAEVFPGGALLPNGTRPFYSPWRIIAVGGLDDIVESTLGTDLAAPAIDMETDFIESGLASWSWVLLKDDFTNYETSRKFIDYASNMNWPYCLIDADWDWKIGYDRMQELVDYAAEKNVKILLWYNSSGSWNSTTYTPKSKLVNAEERRAEFARLQKMGVAGCKVDFFGGDGQSMIAYYHDILKDAADHQLLLNFHGATLPRGWHRTYPNLMTVEAIKGEEFITFEQANADLQPSHCAVIPFTRNVYDPMDFTPMALDSIPNIVRRTTTTFELALPVLFTSGVQHIAEIPEGMEKMPKDVVAYLKDIPTRWDESRFLQGFPGKEVVMARRKGSVWHIVGINGEPRAKTITLDLSFAENQQGVLFYDGDSSVPQQKTIQNQTLEVVLQPNGGFVVKI
ncbi:MAG: glycoside hydrolase family 97 protein [Saprospiraceae bacterium]|nr:glycoside hydrolase family 97 protein [Saprospiraceae bacterium]